MGMVFPSFVRPTYTPRRPNQAQLAEAEQRLARAEGERRRAKEEMQSLLDEAEDRLQLATSQVSDLVYCCHFFLPHPSDRQSMGHQPITTTPNHKHR